MTNKTICVVGAGIAGLTVAYYAVKKGYKVTVIDEEHYPAMRCSYANGGQISVSNSEVWNTWANIGKGIKWILKKDAPLLIRPSLDLDKAIWLAKFLYHTAVNDYARNTAQTIRLGLEARKCYNDIGLDDNIAYNRLNTGILHIYKNENYFQSAIRVKELYNANGCEWDIIDNYSDILRIEPMLHQTDGIVGAIYTKSDFVGDIHKFCTNLANLLETYYYVDFYYNRKVDNLAELFKYDKIVIANGIGSKALAKTIGDKIPVYPVKGYSITIKANTVKNVTHMPKVSLLDDESKIVSSFLDGNLRVAGTAEFAGENYDIRSDRIKPLLNWVHDNFTNVNAHDYSSWACLRPMTPNMMPIYTRSKKNERVYYHTGHGHLGWTLAPYTAKLLIQEMSQHGTT